MKLKVEAIRKQLELRQDEMAKILGMTTATYISRVKGVTDWKAKEIAKIADMAHMPFDMVDFN